MAQQQPIRVTVDRRGGFWSGCVTFLGLALLLGLAIEYWPVALGILVLGIAVGVPIAMQRRKKARHRPGPRDPWLNEIAVALADLGLTERARNTGNVLAGVPLEGDIGFDAKNKSVVFVSLFADAEQARQAEDGLLAKPDVRQAMSNGHEALTTVGRLVCHAWGRTGGLVDQDQFASVVQAVASITPPPPLHAAGSVPETSHPRTQENSAGSTEQVPTTSPDVLGQLQQLGELHASGVLTDAEFEAKKADLLRRV